jgi:hypothetical protein
MKQTIRELAARTSEYEAVIEADGDRMDAASPPRILLRELRSLLARESLRAMSK